MLLSLKRTLWNLEAVLFRLNVKLINDRGFSDGIEEKDSGGYVIMGGYEKLLIKSWLVTSNSFSSPFERYSQSGVEGSHSTEGRTVNS